jgi:hypothetical protein
MSEGRAGLWLVAARSSTRLRRPRANISAQRHDQGKGRQGGAAGSGAARESSTPQSPGQGHSAEEGPDPGRQGITAVEPAIERGPRPKQIKAGQSPAENKKKNNKNHKHPTQKDNENKNKKKKTKRDKKKKKKKK